MSTSIKTAISIQQDLFDAINQLAQELHISRSKLFMLAVEDFIAKNKNRQLLAQINAAYDDAAPDAEEIQVQTLMKQKQARRLEAEAW
jgi:metal-responsive CopG/Arc/MetJ family transcriptional regulator